MSTQHPNILYVGSRQGGRALDAMVAPLDWYVHLPQNTYQALGMYVAGYPDVVVLDVVAQPAFASEVYVHLRSLEGVPVLMIVLGGDVPYEPDDLDVILPYHTDEATLVDVIREMLGTVEAV